MANIYGLSFPPPPESAASGNGRTIAQTCQLLLEIFLIGHTSLEYILLTGPTKLFGNEVCKNDGGPSAKHEDRSQILQAEFPNNFVRLRSVRCFLHAAVPGAVFDGIRPLFRLKIT